MKNQAWMMAVCMSTCCLLPVLLVSVAPAVGLNKQSMFFIFIVVMFLCCFMMIRRGDSCCDQHKDEDQKNKPN